MKKAILLSLLFVACVFTASAQKFALIDMESVSYTHLTLPTN